MDISDEKKNYITCIAYEKNAEAINSLAIGDRIYASVQIKPEDFKERSGKDFNKFFITAVAVASSEKNGVEKVNRQQRNDGWESEFQKLSEYLKKFEKNQ